MKLLLTILLLSLTTGTRAQEKHDLETLLGCWTDSREENTTEFQVFHPCDHMTFPASWFRFSMVLKENGACEWLYLAPNDAHHMRPGTWKFFEGSNTLKIYNEEGQEIGNYQIVEIGKDQLKWRKG